MNTDSAVNVLWAETDKPGLRERLAALTSGGVKVAWATYSDNGGGHAAIIIETPIVSSIRTPGEDRAMLRKLSLTHSYFVTAIDGDRHAGLRGMTKNPFSSRWPTDVGDLTPRSLNEILVPLQAMAKALGWKAPKRRFRRDRNEREPSPEGRNCALFDLTRWWAGDSCVRDGAAILHKAMQVNAGFAVPLGHGEVACVARSITRFMVNRYDGQGLHAPMTPEKVKVRQAAGRAAQAERQLAERDDRLLVAVAAIRARGEELGQIAVATEAGLSLRTVQAAWSGIWDRIVNNPQALPSPSGSSITHADEAASAIPAVAPQLADDVLDDAAWHPLDDEPAVPMPFLVRVRWPRTAVSRRLGEVVRRANLNLAAGLAADFISLAELPDNGHRNLKPVDWSPEAVARQRRRASKERCAKRIADHERAAQGGLRFYRDFVASRFRALFQEKARAIADCALEPEEEINPLVLATAQDRAQERIKLIRYAFSAKEKAEMRVSRRLDDELQLRERWTLHPCRMRTTLDGIDIIARAIRPKEEEEAVAGGFERSRIRLAA